jgi:hypothetical protein
MISNKCATSPTLNINIPPQHKHSKDECVEQVESLAQINPPSYAVLGSVCKEKEASDAGRATGLCGDSIATQLLILKQRRMSSSQYLSNIAAVTTNGPQIENSPLAKYSYVNWKQSSDRNQPSIVPATSVVPTRGNSLRSSITRLRPGSTQSGGEGVDVKHNSYNRFLNKLKSNTLRKGWSNQYKPAPLPSNPYANSINDGICVPIC